MNRQRCGGFGVVLGLVIFCAFPSRSAELDKVTVGESKPTWSNLPGVDGKVHSLADLDQDVVVVAITCNHCPIAMEYFERLNQFAGKYGPEGKVALVAVNVSNWETDKLPRMKKLAERESLKFPYLHDETQHIARELGASVTPQFFVLDRERTLVYRGPWDDNVNGVKVKTRYVEDAVEAVLQGKQPPVTEARAVGCGIQYGQ